MKSEHDQRVIRASKFEFKNFNCSILMEKSRKSRKIRDLTPGLVTSRVEWNLQIERFAKLCVCCLDAGGGLGKAGVGVFAARYQMNFEPDLRILISIWK